MTSTAPPPDGFDPCRWCGKAWVDHRDHPHPSGRQPRMPCLGLKAHFLATTLILEKQGKPATERRKHVDIPLPGGYSAMVNLRPDQGGTPELGLPHRRFVVLGPRQPTGMRAMLASGDVLPDGRVHVTEGMLSTTCLDALQAALDSM